MNKHDIENIKGCCSQFRKNMYLGKYDYILQKTIIGVVIIWIGIGIYLFS